MAQPNSESWQTDDLSSEDENFPILQEEEPFEMFGSGSDEEFSLQTPEQKPTAQKKGSQDNISESYLNSGMGSSDISTKEGSEAVSSSSSSSDGESSTYRLPTGVLQPKMIEIEADTFDMKENLHKPEDGEAMIMEKDMLYEKLLEKVANYETELKFTKNKLQASQDEAAKLKYENLTLVKELGGAIEKLQISEENMKEMDIKLRNEFQESQANFQAKINLADHSLHLLQAELASERNRGSDYSRQVDELEVALHDAQEDYFKDKSQFQSDITILQEQNDALKSRLNEAEMRHKMLEEEKMEMGKFHEAREANLLGEIRQIHMEVSEKNQLVNSLNKSLDASKLKYDVLMSEKDEIFAKLETIRAEVNCRDINIQQLEGHISKLRMEQKEMVAKSQKSQKLAEELGLKVMDQEEELGKQRVLVCERADEKREAIRQLCYSLEYYRTEYDELRQALLKYKRPAAMAS